MKMTDNLSNIENIIKDNAKEYYTTGKQKISDESFDALVNKVKKEKPDSEVLTTGWGYNVDSNNNKVKHKYNFIGSLDKVKTKEDIEKFLSKRNYTQSIYASIKLDGLSVILYYIDGCLERAVTRGNGIEGIDITDKVKIINPNFINLRTKEINYDFTGAIRGEIIMLQSDFNEYVKKYPEAKNPRNSAAGIINSIDNTEDLKYLSIFVYTIVANENNRNYYTPYVIDCYKMLEQCFDSYVVPYQKFSVSTEINVYKNFMDKYNNFPCDGVVISYPVIDNDKGVYRYYQIALKFQDEVVVTTVKHIEWTMSKNQIYIPVVVFEPVELEGTTVQRASGYNAKFIEENNIHTGSIISVKKANKIIPKIVEVINDI